MPDKMAGNVPAIVVLQLLELYYNPMAKLQF